MNRTVSAARVAALVGNFDRSPAYAGLAEALRVVIGDGRIGLDTRLPSERELTEHLGVSRTTITRAYAELRAWGFASARQGAGTFTRVPGGRGRALDRSLLPVGNPDAIDLNCAASSAPPGLAAAYADAAADLPAYFSGHGYFPGGLPELQEAIAADYAARGLPTRPTQIMVTSGALAAAAVIAQTLLTRGDHVVAESPVYPNAIRAFHAAGGRVTGCPVDPDGWDLDAVGASLRQVRPRLAYLVPDFQNPTGHLMTEVQREVYAGHLRRTATVAVVDESHQALALDGQEMPPPFAAYAPDTITLGSASKTFWGGMRLGWIRAPEHRMAELIRARVALDLGASVLEQLVLARLLADAAPILTAHRERLRDQRQALATAVTEQLPQWSYQLPTGGLALWCRLPSGSAATLAVAAEALGVIVAPGPVFAIEGGLDRFVRIPWTRPAEELREAVARLSRAWAVVGNRPAEADSPRPRVVVA